MSDNNSSGSNNSFNFLGFLALLFIGLKLTGHITWPWVWVLAPLWMPFSVIVVVAAFALIVYAIVSRGN